MKNLTDDYIYLDTNTGKYVPKTLYRYIHPYWLTFNRLETAVPLSVAAAPALAKPVNFFVQNNSVAGEGEGFGTPLLAKYIVFADSTDTTALSNVTVFMRNFNGRDYMNQPVHIRTLAGTARLPAVLREPLFLESISSISTQFQKISGGAVNIWMYLAGKYFYPGSVSFKAPNSPLSSYMKAQMDYMREREKYVHPFWLTTAAPDAPVVLTASQTRQVDIKISDTTLELYTIMAASTGNFALEIQEVRTGQTLMNGRITQTNSIGDATFPTKLPFSYKLPQGARLRLTFQDLSAGTNTIFLTFQGRKIFAPIKDVPELDRIADDYYRTAQNAFPMVAEPVGV